MFLKILIDTMAKGFTGLQILVFQLVITSLLMGRNVTGIAHSSSLVVPSPLTGIIELTTIKSKQASPPIIELVVATKCDDPDCGSHPT
jgi:hypothetical protein